jgi:hypothetical protein
VGRIKLLLRLLHEQMIDNWPLMQQAFVSRLGQPPPDGHQAKQRLTGLLAELVREAQFRGEIRADVEAEIVRDLILVTHMRHLGNCIHRTGAPPPVGNSDQIIDMLLEGLAGPGWTGSRPG